MKIQQAYLDLIKKFKQHKFIITPGIDAQQLICHALKINKNDFILLKDEKDLTETDYNKIQKLGEHRIKGQSIACIIRKKHFYDIELFVNEDVLIPRPETEIIIEIALELLDNRQKYQALDIGTGSGAIPITLAKHLPGIQFDAIDVSEKALKVAKKNRFLNKIGENRINFINANFFNYTPLCKYDIIISNPPYIPADEVKELLADKVVADPVIALDGGIKGLDFYEYLKGFSQLYLKNKGIIILEHGYKQKQDIINIYQNQGYKITNYKDLAGLDRVIKLEKN